MKALTPLISWFARLKTEIRKGEQTGQRFALLTRPV